MGFKVAFVDHIKTVSVAELVEKRSVRIMGCPYGINVKLLHLDKVHFHMSHIRIISCIRVAVVSVGASELCMTVVDLENAVLYRDISQSHFLTYKLISRSDEKFVKIRSFGRPEYGVLHFKSSGYPVGEMLSKKLLAFFCGKAYIAVPAECLYLDRT